MNSIKEFCGCLPCLLEGMTDSHCDIHHVLFAGERIGDHATYGNCPWHHRGIVWEGLNPREMKQIIGPSMMVDRAEYRSKYGSEEQLWATQNYMLLLLQTRPWQSFATPAQVAYLVRSYWGNYPDMPKAEAA